MAVREDRSSYPLLIAAIPGTPHVGRRSALLLAAACLAGLALTWVLAELVPAGRFKDATILYDVVRLDGPRLGEAAGRLLKLLAPPLYGLWAVVLVAVGLRRGRRRLAVAAALVLVLAPLTAELLKPLLAHPHDSAGGLQPVAAASWPSAHTTAATTLVLCAVLIVPAAWRTATAAIGAAFALAVGASLVLLAYHMPSDVLGGYLLATLWVSIAFAALDLGRRSPRSGYRGRSSAAWPPGAHNGSVRSSLPGAVATARARMNSMSDSRLR